MMSNTENQDKKYFFAEHYFPTIEDLEKALQDSELREIYNKNFEEDEKESK